MSEMVDRLQLSLRKSSSNIFLFFFKLITGLALGLTLALMVQEVLGQTDKENFLSFIFMLVAFTAIFLRLAKSWSFTTVLIFDLFCVLVGIILRLYIMVAPGT